MEKFYELFSYSSLLQQQLIVGIVQDSTTLTSLLKNKHRGVTVIHKAGASVHTMAEQGEQVMQTLASPLA